MASAAGESDKRSGLEHSLQLPETLRGRFQGLVSADAGTAA